MPHRLSPGARGGDLYFYAILAGSLLALGAVLAPFLYAILVAAVLVQVTWPLFRKLRKRLGGRAYLAAGVMTALVLLVLAAPITGVLWLAAREAAELSEAALSWLSGGGLDHLLADAYEALDRTEGAPLPEPGVLGQALSTGLQALLVEFSSTLGSGVPGLLERTGRVLLDLGVFVLALYGLYAAAPDIVAGIRDLLPLEDAYVDRLFEVFEQFSRNVVWGMVATGIAQGIVAAIGFRIAGVGAAVALGVASALLSVVPFVGLALVWVPVAISLAVQGSPGWAAFVVLWSLGVTASVDNVLRPFVLRARLQVSPILILLSVLGGALTFGAKGLVLGPLVLLLFLTLFTFYRRDYLHGP